MADEKHDEQGEEQGGAGTGQDYKALYEQAKADAEKWKAMSRNNEGRAKSNAEAASALEDVQKRLASIEGENASLRIEATRAKVAEEFGVPASLVFGEDEEAMRTHAKELAEFAKKPAAAHVRGAGSFDRGGSGSKEDEERREFVRKLFGKE